MIAPNMATMLAFITTDAVIAPVALQEALRVANNHSFNRLTVDGDMSTNDMVLVLANGLAKEHRNSEEYSGVPAISFCAGIRSHQTCKNDCTRW